MADKPQKQPDLEIAYQTIRRDQRALLAQIAIKAREAKGAAEALITFMNANLAHPNGYEKIRDEEFITLAERMANAATAAHERAFAVRLSQDLADEIATNVKEGTAE